MISELDDYGLSYNDLTETQKEFFLTHIWNGVGSDHYFINPHDLIFKEASIYHDFYYWRGGPKSLRKLADKDFLHRCHEATRKLPMKRRLFYYVASYTYFLGLKVFGNTAWEKGKVCQTWDELVERYSAKVSKLKK